MEKSLQKLYAGKLDPTSFYRPQSVEYWRKSEKVERIIEKWADKLEGDDQLDIFDDILSIYIEMSAIDKEEAFQSGFYLVVKLMSEAYSAKLFEEQ